MSNECKTIHTFLRLNEHHEFHAQSICYIEIDEMQQQQQQWIPILSFSSVIRPGSRICSKLLVKKNSTLAERTKIETEKKNIRVYFACGAGSSAENVNMLRKRVCKLFSSLFCTYTLTYYIRTCWQLHSWLVYIAIGLDVERSSECDAMLYAANVVTVNVVIIIII